MIIGLAIDNIWGIGFTKDNAESNRAHWGTNLLGKALMLVRDRLREEEEKAREVEGPKEGTE